MRATRIPSANLTLGAPTDWDNSKGVTCDPLHVHMVEGPYGRVMVSQWQPSEEEIALINQGRPVYLCVWGNSHPPVLLSVEPEENDGAAN